MTKHEQVFAHIEALPVQKKVSVRQLARDLGVSEGTVYRAIKEAESQGLVSSIPKVGTIRIETPQDRSRDSLTYEELALTIEGRVLQSLDKDPSGPKNFYVALNLESLKKRRLHRGTMVLSDGNQDVVATVLKKGYDLLLLSGARVDEDKLQAFAAKNLAVLSTPFEAFEAITAINKALFDRGLGRELVKIKDIMSSDPLALRDWDQVSDWQDLAQRTGKSHFPIVDANFKLVGMASAIDVTEAEPQTLLDDIMTPNPISVHPEELTSYLARILVWESVEVVPVVDDEGGLVGTVSRQDMIASLQSQHRQVQMGDTFDNLVMSGFQLEDRDKDAPVVVSGKITKYMLDESGFLSTGNTAILTTIAAEVAVRMKTSRLMIAKNYAYQRYRSFEEGMWMRNKVSLYTKDQHFFQVAVDVEDDQGTPYGLATLTMTLAEK